MQHVFSSINDTHGHTVIFLTRTHAAASSTPAVLLSVCIESFPIL